VDRPGDELLAGARLAEDEDGGVGRRDHLHLGEDPPQGGALPDDPAVGQGEVDLLAQVRVLFLEPPSQPVDLREGPPVDDRDRRVLGDGPEPPELVLRDRGPPEDRQDANGLPAEDERLSGEALDALPPHPLGARPALGPRILQQKGRTGRSDPTHLGHSQRNAAEVPVETRPIFARGRARRAGARDQMETPRLVGTLRPHPARVADVPGAQHPDDAGEHAFLGALARDSEGNRL